MATRYCSGCGVEARQGARFCAACGAELLDSTAVVPASGLTGAARASTPTGRAEPLTVVASPAQQPVGSGMSVAADDLAVFPWWQVIVFTIISFGIWTPYWFYCTRKQLNTILRNGRTDPGVQTLGAFFPIWQFWVARDLWRDINDVATRGGTPGIDSKSYTVGYVICSIPIINNIGFIVVLVLFLITQSRLMAALKALAGDSSIGRRVTAWSAVWAVGPIAAWLLLVVITSLTA